MSLRFHTLLFAATAGVVLGISAGARLPASPVPAAEPVHRTTHAPVSDTLLVKLRDGSLDADELASDGDLTPVRSLPDTGALLLRVNGDTASMLQRLNADPRVEWASADHALHAALTPNDRVFARQWALQTMQVPWAWELTRGESSVVVGVLDSGVDLSHPDLAAHILPIGCNLIADKQCYPDGKGTPPVDPDGHGTNVAGIIAALTDNREGIAGIAWNASILPVRITQNDQGLESDFITGLLWAVDHGANVLNFSFSEDCGTPESPALRDALNYAWSHGAVLVASAGNGGGCNAGVFPAADPHVLAVASTDMNDKPSSFSNFGPWVKISAPGERILTTFPGGEYSIGSGTSFAAPQVAGIAALLMSLPGATNANAVNWITSTCDVPDGWNPAYGCGRVNAYRAVTLAVKGKDPHTGTTTPQTLHLQQGWNNLLYLGPARQVDSALAPLKGKVGSVYQWDPVRTTWSAYLPAAPAASDLQILTERGAYWVYMQSAADFSVAPTGTNPPPQLTLSPGWNNLGLPSGAPAAALSAFSAPPKSLFGWDATKSVWRGFFSDAAAPSDLSTLRGDTPYWVYATAPIVLHAQQSP
ncbi:MAG TPA: S8 family serine peptidase [Dehalococcoidia bacterium]